jgi:putative ABC transport system substrate-binding protein
MVELGYVEGKNVAYEIVRIPNFSKSEIDPAYRELVRRNVDILVGWGGETGVRAAFAATRKVPIVTASPDFDPVAGGLAKSYHTPGGNLTGIYAVQVELTPKRLQLTTEAFPGVKALTVFWDVYSADQWREAQAAAAKLNLDLFGVEFKKRPYDYERGFAPVPTKYRGHLLVLGSPAFATPERRLLPDFALRQRLRTMFVFRNYVVAGGLLSYGASFSAIIQGAADYVDRIAKGAKPASLPIVQPTKFDFVVNLKTAKALGVTLPSSILLQTTEVIR